MTERPGSRQTLIGKAGEESILGQIGEQSTGTGRGVPGTSPLQKCVGGHRPAGSPKAKSYLEQVNASRGQAESGLGNKRAIGTVGPYTGQDRGRAWGPRQQRERQRASAWREPRNRKSPRLQPSTHHSCCGNNPGGSESLGKKKQTHTEAMMCPPGVCKAGSS